MGFPGLIAPASLKPAPLLTAMLAAQPGFPGLIAPASLKHSFRCRSLPARRRFSGVNRPGLIEARAARRSLATGRVGFPGLIAPASLKLEFRPALMLAPPAGFPGLIAPASLKRRRPAGRAYGIRGFSGVNRPGLIEALRT